MKTHQREERVDIRLVGAVILDKHGAQSHGFKAEVSPEGNVLTGGVVSFVEEQVDGRQDRRQSSVDLRRRGKLNGDLFLAQLFPGPEEPFVDRLFGRQKGIRNLIDAETAEDAER